DLVEALSFAFALDDGFLGSEVVAHDFDQGKTAAAEPGGEALDDDPAQSICQAVADLFLFLGLEHAQDTVNRLTSVNGGGGTGAEVASMRGDHGHVPRGQRAHRATQ